MRTKIVAGNWKMNKSLDEAKALTSEVLTLCKAEVKGSVKVVLCVPYPYLLTTKEQTAGTLIAVGAQNLSAYAEGAYTGEVSAAMLVDVGCAWVIVGHSERRHGFGDTDAVVAAKVIAALDGGLQSILCVGETLAQREAGEAEAVVAVKVRDEDPVDRARREVGVRHLPLRAFARVEEKALVVPADEVPVVVAVARRNLAASPERDQLSRAHAEVSIVRAPRRPSRRAAAAGWHTRRDRVAPRRSDGSRLAKRARVGDTMRRLVASQIGQQRRERGGEYPASK